MENFFAPKSIRQYLHYAVVVSFYLGCFNFTQKNKIYRPSKLKSLVSFFYLIIFISFFVYHFKLTISKISEDNGTNILRVYAVVSGTFVTSLIIFFSASSSEDSCSVANRLLRIEEKYYASDPRAVNTMSFRYLCISLSLISISIIFDCCYFSFDSPFTIFSIYIFLFYTFIIVSTYSILLFYQKKCIIKFRSAMSTFTPVGLGNHTKVMANSILEVKEQVKIEGNTNLDIIQNLRFLYHDLYLLSQEINDLFASRILLIVGHNFVLGTIYMYWGIKQLSKKDDGGTVRAICYFKWALASFVSISGLIWPCRTVCQECKKTAITIMELQTLTKDPPIKQELQSFSVQLIHEKMEFSPHQFFQLRNELLLSILGAVASYLVILSQFQI